MAALTGAECRDLWMRFIIANYLTTVEARGGLKCPHCNSTRECNNHYCLACKEGGLCPTKFKTNQPHDHHPWLQVRRITKENVVHAVAMETFLGENASRIQKFIGNKENIFKMKTPPKSRGKKVKAFDASLQLICRGCDLPISKTSNSKDGVKVCSIECLITYAERVNQLDCLKLEAGVDLQNDAYVHPLTVEEKIGLQFQKKQKRSASSSVAKDEEVQEAQQVDVAQAEAPRESQVPIYDYSAFPLDYQCRTLDTLYESVYDDTM